MTPTPSSPPPKLLRAVPVVSTVRLAVARARLSWRVARTDAQFRSLEAWVAKPIRGAK